MTTAGIIIASLSTGVLVGCAYLYGLDNGITRGVRGASGRWVSAMRELEASWEAAATGAIRVHLENEQRLSACLESAINDNRELRARLGGEPDGAVPGRN